VKSLYQQASDTVAGWLRGERSETTMASLVTAIKSTKKTSDEAGKRAYEVLKSTGDLFRDSSEQDGVELYMNKFSIFDWYGKQRAVRGGTSRAAAAGF
jgi:hypothetical protein